MSVTVAELLTLPSLQNAKVLGGRGGLGKIVSSISVLESTDPGVLIDGIFPKGDFFGSEIVITGFLNSLHDIDLQCSNIRRLAQGGEVGLILFYVGVYLEKVDQRLIDLADELNFVLICMPEGEPTLRYGEVISDVSEYIFRDRIKNDTIVLDILTRVSALPKQQQTVDTAVKMLSDRISASVVLCDSAFRIINLAAWPRSIENEIKNGIESCGAFPESDQSCPCTFSSGGTLYRSSIYTDFGQKMELLIVKAMGRLDETALSDAADVTRICVNIWGKHHGEVAVHELVRAILKDEPMKMRRLAEIFHVDIASIHEMWILSSERDDSGAALKERIPAMRNYIRSVAGNNIMDIYGGRLLIFMNTPQSRQDARQIAETIITDALRQDSTSTLVCCGHLQTTSEVRSAYMCYKEALPDARRVYPRRAAFTLGELEFIRECRAAAQRSEGEIANILLPVKPLRTGPDEQELLQTLAIYLLDCESSVTRTAERMFIHKNTVKYRIRRITDLIGFHPDKMPEAAQLYRAVVLWRLIG